MKLALCWLLTATIVIAQRPSDSIKGASGTLTITPIAHGTVHISDGTEAILVDPTLYGGWDGPHPGEVAPQISYEGLAAPTLILVTDIHGDHYDTGAIDKVKTTTTTVVVPSVSGWQYPAGYLQLANGRSHKTRAVTIEAVRMYNLERGPSPNAKFHIKGRGNGYVVSIGGKRVYFSGDTECTPEMKALKNIDVAFIAMNLPYTATPDEAAGCAAAFKPAVVYPYHYKGQDVKIFESKLAGSGIDVRLRDWYSAR